MVAFLPLICLTAFPNGFVNKSELVPGACSRYGQQRHRTGSMSPVSFQMPQLWKGMVRVLNLQ